MAKLYDVITRLTTTDYTEDHLSTLKLLKLVSSLSSHR